MPGTSFSILSRAALIMGNICLPVQNQSYKHVLPVARRFAKSACERGARTTSQDALVTESYMQMCNMCNECNAKT
jgi:hypothetical protein